ncbi:MAG: hypothetical protein ACI4LX_05595 [Treponema sp.]
MLPGNENLRKEFMDDVWLYAKEHSVHPIYIGMDGSRSKGMDSADSDYDTRVLYVPACLDGRVVHFPWLEEEKNLHQKFYTNEKSEISGKPWEFIPFWEATSFFQFLKCPRFKDCKESSGLYKIVGWTMKTPYSWDPYGLQMKIVPLIDSIFRADYEVGWYKEEIKLYWSQEKDSMLMKHYMKALHASLCIQWMKNCYGVPPVDKHTLIYGNPSVSRDFAKEFENFLNRYRRDCSAYMNLHKDGRLYESHTVLSCEKIKVFDDFIAESREFVPTASNFDEKRIDEVIENIYFIIKESIK